MGTHFNALGNEYWSILESANTAYMSIGQKYLQLLRLCERNGVKFEDMKSFLINQAKKSGLYRKDHYVGNSLKFKPEKVLRKENPAWYRQLILFLQWVDRHYISYQKEKVQKAPVSKGTKGKDKKEASVSTVVRKDAEGNESRTTTVSSSSGEMNEPVTSALSDEQILAIITSNWDILARYCTEKGASAEAAFDSLMEALDI